MKNLNDFKFSIAGRCSTEEGWYLLISEIKDVVELELHLNKLFTRYRYLRVALYDPNEYGTIWCTEFYKIKG
jgi:hypothetical protein